MRMCSRSRGALGGVLAALNGADQAALARIARSYPSLPFTLIGLTYSVSTVARSSPVRLRLRRRGSRAVRSEAH